MDGHISRSIQDLYPGLGNHEVGEAEEYLGDDWKCSSDQRGSSITEKRVPADSARRSPQNSLGGFIKLVKP